MHEFLLLALVIIYLVISYVPTSDASKDTRQSQRHERSSQGNSEVDGTGSHDSPLGS